MTLLKKLRRLIEYYPKRKFNSSYLAANCTLKVHDETLLSSCDSLDCGDTDLNEFFSRDFIGYNNGLFGKTYCFTNDYTDEIVCAFSVSNDSIKNKTLPKKQKKKVRKEIAHSKHFIKSYPAVLVGRLGVSNKYRDLRIGDELMDFIKAWFLNPKNKTGCRFIVVDGYNKDYVLKYYERNFFNYLFDSEENEVDYIGLKGGTKLNSRIMFFDLIKLRVKKKK